MSITSDIRAYADTALEQGKQVLDQAQTQLNDVTDQANGFVSGITTKAATTVGELRAQAEKTVHIDAIKSAVEPYLAQAKGYRHGVTDRANGFYTSVRSDRRVAKFVDTAETLSGVVVGTVQDRVVKPVASLAQPVVSLTQGNAKPTRKPAARKTTATKTAATKTAATKTAAKPATTRPAAKKAPAKSTARKTAAASGARKSPAKKASRSS